MTTPTSWPPDGADLVVEGVVLGEAATAGSKRAFKNPKTDRVVVVDDVGKKGKTWRADVRAVASAAMEGRALLDAPLALDVVFVRPRPRGHFGTGRNAGVLKDSAPAYPITKPDSTKLLRAIEDALTGIVWRDDSRVVRTFVAKEFGEPARAEFRVFLLPDSTATGKSVTLPEQTSLDGTEGDRDEGEVATETPPDGDGPTRPREPAGSFPGL